MEFRNYLLSALGGADRDALLPRLAEISLERGEVLFEPGAPVDTVVFPSTAVLSVATVMFDGVAVESDVRLNKADFDWTTRTDGVCRGEMSVTAARDKRLYHEVAKSVKGVQRGDLVARPAPELRGLIDHGLGIVAATETKP